MRWEEGDEDDDEEANDEEEANDNGKIQGRNMHHFKPSRLWNVYDRANWQPLKEVLH